MRRVEVVEGLRVGFPGRSADFVEGFEIGLLAAALASGWPSIEARIGAEALQQAKDLAHKLGYPTVDVGPPSAGGEHPVTFSRVAGRARLRVVK